MFFTSLVFAAALGSSGLDVETQTPSPAAADALPQVTDLAASDLDDQRGGQTATVTVVNDQALTAMNSGNAITADLVQSGDISVNGTAFNNFAGVGNFIMNTGNNNNMQSSMTVTVVMPPAAN